MLLINSDKPSPIYLLNQEELLEYLDVNDRIYDFHIADYSKYVYILHMSDCIKLVNSAYVHHYITEKGINTRDYKIPSSFIKSIQLYGIA